MAYAIVILLDAATIVTFRRVRVTGSSSVKRVDLLGPAGIGKTFLLNALTPRLPPRMYEEGDAKVAAAEVILRRRRSATRWLVRSLIKTPVLRSATNITASSIFREHARRTGLDHLLEHEDFLKAIIECAARAGKPPSLKVEAVVRVHRNLRELHTFDQLLPMDTVFMSDEPLSKKIYSFCSMHEGDLLDIVRLYARTMPQPDLVVHAYCDPRTAMERIAMRSRTRGKTVYNHRVNRPRDLEFIVERQQTVSRVICGVLKEQGVPIIEIDTASDVDHNVNVILSGLNRLRSDGAPVAAH
jgi:hypothetical protein